MSDKELTVVQTSQIAEALESYGFECFADTDRQIHEAIMCAYKEMQRMLGDDTKIQRLESELDSLAAHRDQLYIEINLRDDKNAELRREVERLNNLICHIHQDLVLRANEEGVVSISDWIWQEIKAQTSEYE